MAANETVVPTATQKESSSKYVKKTAVKLKIKCRIEEFETLIQSTKPGEGCLWSMGVLSELVPGAEWKLEIYPNGDVEQSKDHISVYLNLTGEMVGSSSKTSKENLDATYRLYLINESNGKIDSIWCSNENFGKEYYARGRDVSHARVRKALDGEVLTVAADVEFFAPDDSSVKAIRESNLFTKWQSSIGKLRESEAHSDCTLMVGGEELKTHCSILAAISPHLEALFRQEEWAGVVRIAHPSGTLKDSTATPYRALLSYAYTGCIDWTDYDDCKGDVLVVACKYLVDDLKHHMEGLLANEITPESFVEVALLADTYTCDQLKKACVKYLSSNYAAVVNTPEWVDLMETRGDLAKKLIRLAGEDETTTTDGGGTN